MAREFTNAAYDTVMGFFEVPTPQETTVRARGPIRAPARATAASHGSRAHSLCAPQLDTIVSFVKPLVPVVVLIAVRPRAPRPLRAPGRHAAHRVARPNAQMHTWHATATQMQTRARRSPSAAAAHDRAESLSHRARAESLSHPALNPCPTVRTRR